MEDVQYCLARKVLCNTALHGRCAILPCKEGVVQYCLARKKLCNTALQERSRAILPCKEDVVQYCLARKMLCNTALQGRSSARLQVLQCPKVPHRHQSLLHVQLPCVLLQRYQYGLIYVVLSRDYRCSAAQHLGTIAPCRTGSDGSADTTLCGRRLPKVWFRRFCFTRIVWGTAMTIVMEILQNIDLLALWFSRPGAATFLFK